MDVTNLIVTMLVEAKVFATTTASPTTIRTLFVHMITEEKSVFKGLLVAIPKYQSAIELVRCSNFSIFVFFKQYICE